MKSIAKALAVIAALSSAVALANKATIEEQTVFDAFPAPVFEQISLNDGMATLLAVKGNDGLMHHVISLQDDARCDGRTATTLGNTYAMVNGNNVDFTRSCSTAGTLYMAAASYKDDQTIETAIMHSNFLTVNGANVGNAVFSVENYSQTLRNFALK